jgi:hypothetical protein
VPSGATVASANGSSMVYRSGSNYYHVTYAPNGSYTYVVTSSPSVPAAQGTYRSPSTTSTPASSPTVLGSYNNGSPAMGSSPTVGGTYGAGTPSNSRSTGGSMSVLPTTGGGSPSTPSFPFVPALAGLALTILGIISRRIALAIR